MRRQWDILEKAMAPHSSTLAWKIPWMEDPGKLQSKGSLRVGHDWATSLSLFTFMHWRRKWQPTTVFLPGEFQRQWAPVYVVAQSWTRLKQLSSSSSSRELRISFKAVFTFTPAFCHYLNVQQWLGNWLMPIMAGLTPLPNYLFCQLCIKTEHIFLVTKEILT